MGITDHGVVAVVVVSIGSSVGSSSRGSVDYGLRGYGFVGIMDWVRMSRGCGLQDYGVFQGPLIFVTTQALFHSFTCLTHFTFCARGRCSGAD